MAISEDSISVAARAEGDGGLIGDLFLDIEPGESFFGLTLQQLKALGVGKHHLTQKN